MMESYGNEHLFEHIPSHSRNRGLLSTKNVSLQFYIELALIVVAACKSSISERLELPLNYGVRILATPHILNLQSELATLRYACANRCEGLDVEGVGVANANQILDRRVVCELDGLCAV